MSRIDKINSEEERAYFYKKRHELEKIGDEFSDKVKQAIEEKNSSFEYSIFFEVYGFECTFKVLNESYFKKEPDDKEKYSVILNKKTSFKVKTVIKGKEKETNHFYVPLGRVYPFLWVTECFWDEITSYLSPKKITGKYREIYIDRLKDLLVTGLSDEKNEFKELDKYGCY